MAARARRDPAAERRELERLRDVPEREPVRPEARRREPQLVEMGRRGDLRLGHGEAGGEEPRDRRLLLGRRSLALPAPAPEPASTRRRHARGWVKRMFFFRIPSSTISTPPL